MWLRKGFPAATMMLNMPCSAEQCYDGGFLVRQWLLGMVCVVLVGLFSVGGYVVGLAKT